MACPGRRGAAGLYTLAPRGAVSSPSLGAISKVPAAGCALIVAYGVRCELTLDQSRVTDAGTGDVGFKVLISGDPARMLR